MRLDDKKPASLFSTGRDDREKFVGRDGGRSSEMEFTLNLFANRVLDAGESR